MVTLKDGGGPQEELILVRRDVASSRLMVTVRELADCFGQVEAQIHGAIAEPGEEVALDRSERVAQVLRVGAVDAFHVLEAQGLAGTWRKYMSFWTSISETTIARSLGGDDEAHT